MRGAGYKCVRDIINKYAQKTQDENNCLNNMQTTVLNF